MSKKQKLKRKQKRQAPVIESLEPRILLSADLPGLDVPDLDPNDPLDADVEKILAQALEVFEAEAAKSIAAASEALAEPAVEPLDEPDVALPSSELPDDVRRELIIVDPTVEDHELLLAGVTALSGEDTRLNVVMIDPQRSGIEQISEILVSRNDLSAIHLISHGSDGAIRIGSDTIDLVLLQSEPETFREWGGALTAEGDILVYGCDVAETETGQVLIDTLAEMTRADVAASDDLTGSADKGGDWELEYRTGEIDSAIVAGAQALSEWAAVLADGQHEAEYYSAPLAFEENLGQTGEKVDFVARGSGYTVFLSEGDAVLAIGNGESQHVVRLDLVGANGDALAMGQDALASQSNYLVGSDQSQWQTDVDNHGAVYYSEVYDGIDVRYYGNQRQLEYDFIVDPGSDPNNIRLNFDGIFDLQIADNGELRLILNEAGEETRFKAPVSYQTADDGSRIEVSSTYVIHDDGTVGFSLGEYDISHELVIDPILDYGTYLGGTGTDMANAIKVDGAGNVYVTGSTGSVDFPSTTGPFGTAGGGDVFVTKLSADGSGAVFTTYLGGSGNDQGFDLDIDSSGNVYVVGKTASADFPNTVGAFDETLSGASDGFVVKLDAAGASITYGSYIGSNLSNDAAYGVAVDGSGQAHVTGTLTGGVAGFTTAGAYQTTQGGGRDAFLGVFSADGSSMVYGSYLGGSGAETGQGIVLDGAGNVYITGVTNSSDMPVTAGTAYQASNGGGLDAFFVKLNPAGGGASDLQYGTYLGGTNADDAKSIAVDASGRAYVVGITVSADFDTTAGAYDTSFSGADDDGFLTVIDPSLSGAASLAYSTKVGGTAADEAAGVAVDSAGVAWITGTTASTTFPTTADAYDATKGGTRDAYLTAIDPGGAGAADLVYSTFLGGAGDDFGYDIALDSSDHIYLAGETRSADFDATAGAYDEALAGTSDGFVAKFWGADLVVDTTADVVDGTTTSISALLSNKGADGFISLREAVVAANNTAGADDISVGTGSYLLSSAITISSDMTISGAGVGLTVIDAQDFDRVFPITSGTVNISGVTLQNGNSGGDGGGVHIANGVTVAMSDVLLTGHDATSLGGAIWNDGTLTLDNATIDLNTASNGGGLYNRGTATITDSTFSNNTTTGDGGGIWTGGAGNPLNLSNVTISGNNAGSDGGGLYNGNDATLTNVTITENEALNGAGIHDNGGPSTTTLSNTIVAGNIDTNDADNPDITGSYNSGGYNLIGNRGSASGFTDGLNGDQVGESASQIDPKLGALGDNGGPTLTHALLAGSRALDTGTDTGAPATDQRGISRGANVDMGAYEMASVGADALWLTSKDDVPSSGAPGLNTWTAGEALEFGDPNLELGPANTDGTFSSVLDLNPFFDSGNVDIEALHYVTRDITVGSGANTFDLKAGDVLFAIAVDDAISGVPYLDSDLHVFRPHTVGDYSSGTISVLLDTLTTYDLRAITLVEQDTWVGDVLLQAGEFLYYDAYYDGSGGGRPLEIRHFDAVEVGKGTTSGTRATFIDTTGAFNLTQGIGGMELIESETVIGGQTLAAGMILATTAEPDSVGDNLLSVDDSDVFAMEVSKTQMGSGTNEIRAMMFVDGSLVNLADSGEDLVALSLKTTPSAPPNAAPVFIENGVGYWQLEEGAGATTADSAYDSSTGTLGSTGGVDVNDPTWTTGVFGQALNFDGVDDYVEIADAPELDISGPEFSASLWVKPDRDPGTEDMFFMKGDRQGIGNVNYYLSWKDTGKMTWAFKSDGGFEYLDMDVTLPTLNEWNHVAVVFDRPTVSIYINGTEYTSSVGTGGTSMDKDLVANDEPLWIGAGRDGGSIVTPGNYSAPFSGGIDEFAVYDRALTSAEIEIIRTSQPAAATANAFTLDENSANSTVVGTVAASDQDTGDTLSYSITGGNTGGAFAIGANGTITVANSAALDFESNPIFTLTIEATDDGTPNLSDTTSVSITLNDVNDAPVARPDGVHLSFDGDDFVEVADHASLQMTNEVTMEARIKHDGTGTGSQVVVNKEGEYELGITANTGEIKFAIARSDNTWAWHNTGYFVTPGEWTHVAVTYDGVAGEAKTYINGELVDTYGQSGAIGDVYAGFNNLWIGGRENDPLDRFNGQIDEVRVWDTVRTQGEVQSNMDGQLSGGEAGLAGNWRLDEAAGGAVLDQSVNGNDGVLGGSEGAAATPTYQGYVTDQNTVLSIAAGVGVLANDTDVDSGSLTVTNLDTTGMLGILALNTADGSFGYDPNGAFDYLGAGEQATETFTYTANDGSLDSNTVTATIMITGVDDWAVISGDIGYTGNEGDAVSGTMGATDVEGLTDGAYFTVTTPATNGAAAIDVLTGAWTYTVVGPDWFGSDSFEVTITDDLGGITTQIVNIDLANVNDTSVANADAYSVDEDGSLIVDWWDSDWTRRQELTFDNLAQSETLTDFPVLVVLNSGNIDYAFTKDDGSDLRFFAANGTPLAYQIEQWNEGGDSSVWVRVPQITGSSNTDSITMYYGNAAAMAPNMASVWDSDFVGVWHLNEEQAGAGSAGTYKDATGQGHDGIDRVAATGQDGQVTDGQEFGANDWIEIDHDPSLDLKDSMTISFWIKQNSNSGNFNRVVEKGLWGYGDSYYFGGGDGTNDLTFYLNGQEVIDTADGVLTVGAWQHAAVSYTSNGDGTGTARMYLDGVEIATGNYTNGAVVGNSGRLAIGHSDPSYDFDGFIDEVQISKTDRSADWIAAQHQATKNEFGSEFVQLGVAEVAPATDGVVTNDTDIDVDLLTASIVSGPSNAASFTFNKDGTFSYTPNSDFAGTDTFTYKVNDGTADSNTQTVTITVNPVNDAPSGADKTISTNEDADYTFSTGDFGFSDVNDTPVDSLADVIIATAPSSGILYVDSDGDGVVDGGETLSATDSVTLADIAANRLKFKPGTDANGIGYDSFTFRVRDDGGTAGGGVDVDPTVNTITIDVTAVDDTAVISGDIGYTGNEGDAVSGTMGATDVDGLTDGTYFTVTTPATNGTAVIDVLTGAWTYTPAGPDWFGTDSFEVIVTDDLGGITTQIVNLVLSNVNDNAVAADDTYSVDEDGTLAVDWWDADWTSRQTLTFGNLAQTENLTNFTVLVKLDAGNIDYAKTKDDGSDLRFFDPDGTALAYEIDTWNESGDSFVWVEIPQIDGASNTDHIVMYYGNAAATDGQAAASVWDSGYASVWHMDNDPTLGVGAIDDSVANPLDGTAVNMDAGNLVAGKVGSALSFDGIDEAIRVDSGAADKLAVNGNQLTIEAWVKRDGATGGWMVVVNRQLGTDNSDAYVTAAKYDAPGTYILNTDGGYVQSSAGAVPDATWQYLTAVQDGTDLLLYSNGALVGSAAGAGPLVTDDNDVIIGGAENDATSAITEFFKGLIDEVRISDVARSADWVAAQYASMNDAFVTFGGEESAPAVGGVLANDSDVDDVNLTAALVSGPSNAAAFTLNADGSFTYTPTSDFNGTDSFTYKVNDGAADSNVATVTITVNPVNDTGSFGGDVIGSGAEDGGAITGTLSFSDVIDGASAPNFTVTGAATGGAASIDNVTGAWSYTPGADFNGSDSFTVTVTDDDGHSETQVINLTVTPVNDAGIFGGDVIGSGAEDGGAISGTLSFTDLIDGASAPNFTVTGSASSGSASIDSGTGAWSYTPGADFNGSDSFTVTVTDDDGHSETQVINLTVTPVNDAGIFGGDTSGSGAEDGGAISGTLSFTDAIDGASAPNFTVTTDGVNGSASIDPASGAWSYTPGADFNGSDSFTVTVTDDDGHTETQVISLTVTPVNDAGSFGGDTSGSGAEDGGAISGTLSFTDAIDGASTPNFTVTGAAGNGSANIDNVTGAWSYTPGADFNGSDSFTVTVTDDDGHSETQVINLTVTPVNDAGSFGGDTSGSGAEDGGAISGTLSFTDLIDGASAPNFTVTGAATDGSASINPATGAWSYTPGADFNGSDSFTVTVTDDDGHSEIQVISLTVTPVNDAGSFGGDTSGSGAEDGGAISGTLSFTDAIDGDSTPNFTVTGSASSGSASIDSGTGAWSYTLGADFNGSDSFTVTVTDDDGHSETQVISLTVTPVNDAGSFGGDTSGSGAEDGGAISGTLSFTDAIDGASAPNFTVTGAATDGSASINPATGAWSYTPGADFNGSDSFTVTVTDDDGHSETQVISLTVTPVNDAGSFGGDTSGSGAEDGGAIMGTLSFTDAIDGASAPNFTVTTDGVNGSASIDSGTGAWSYTPGADFNGSDSFTVTVTDDDGHSETQVINLTVTPVNDAGSFGGDTGGSGAEDGGAISGTLSFTDLIDGASAPNFTVTGAATDGSASINPATGAWSYTPGADFNGTDSFTVTVTDDDGHSETQVISLTVTPVNDAGSFGGDVIGSGAEDGGAISGTLSFTDLIDGASAPNFTVTGSATDGSASINPATGAWSYTPGADFNGTDSFTVTVTDDDGHSETQVISITVDAVNDEPGLTLGANQSVGYESGAHTVVGFASALPGGGADEAGQTFSYTVTNNNNGLFSAQPVINASGELSYTVAAGQTGSATVTVSVTDSGGTGNGGDDTSPDQTFTITVGANAAPTITAMGDQTIAEDGATAALAFTVGDAETAAGSLVVTASSSDQGLIPDGSLSLVDGGSGNWTIQATPLSNQHGTATITLTVDDGTTTTLETFDVTVTSQDDPVSIGGNTSGTGDEDTAITGTLTATDTADGLTDGTYFSVTTDGVNGSASIDPASGAWSYTPGADFNGSDSFTVTVTDDDGHSETQVISLTVTPVNDAGSFGGDTSGSGAEDGGAISGTLSFTDAIDGDSTPNFTVTGSASSGSASIDSGTGAWSYTPGADFNGSDSFTVTVTDDDGHSETQVISLTVTPVNDAGIFGGDTSGSGAEDGGAISGTLSFTDLIDGASAPNFTVTGAATDGSASINPATGAWSYTPGADFNGSDSFTVTVTDDDGHSETQVINLTVTPVNDAGSFGGDTGGSGAEDGGAISGTLSFTDAIDGASAPNFTVTGAATDGSASINPATGAWSYTPGADFNGSDSFTVTVTDDDGHSETQVISLTVTPVNDAGSFGGDTSGSGAEDGGAISGTLSFTDLIDGDSAPNFTVTTDGVNGSASIDPASGAWSYTPGADFNGSDSFTVTVTDDDGHSETQVINLTVTPVNDAGSFGGDTSGSGAEDGGAISGTLSFTDAIDGASTPNFTVTGAASSGSASIDPASGAWSYTPGADFNGSDSFTVTVTDDDGHSETQVINLTVTPVNDAGIFAGDTSGSGAEDGGAISGTLSFTDAIDGASTPNFTVTGAATDGSASINPATGAWSYTPGADFNGSDSFTVTVTDDDGHSETQVISITVDAVNDEPGLTLGANQSVGYESGAHTVVGFASALPGGGADESGQTFSYTVTNDNNGLFSAQPVINASGELSYTVAAGQTGSATVTVSVTDSGGTGNGGDDTSPDQTFTITVGANAAPTITAMGDQTIAEDGATAALAFTVGDAETAVGSLVVTASSSDQGLIPDGSLSLVDGGSGNWTIQATPLANQHGTATITLTVDDGTTTTVETFDVTVTSQDDPVSIGGNTSGTGDEDTAITGTLTATDTADGLTDGTYFSVTTDGVNGSASIDSGTGAWSYTPGADFNGSDSFTVTVTDDDGHSETQVINLTVTPVNDAGIFGGDVIGSGVEDGGAISGTLSFTDLIDGDSAPNFTVTGSASSGSASIDSGTGAWSYTPGADFNGNDSFTVTVTDDDGHSETQVINLTVTPVNDAPVIGGVSAGVVSEDVDPDLDMLLEAAGALTIADPDAGESNFVAGTVTGSHGSLIIDASGNWSYEADNTQAAIQQLDAGEGVNDVLTVTTTDGTSHNVTVTISGSEDVAVVSGSTSSAVTEDGTLVANGTLSISDVDTSDNPVSFPDATSVPGDNGYGDFQLTAGNWTYTLDNANAAVQALGAGGNLTDTHAFLASDGSVQMVTVMIAGAAESAPLIVEPPLPQPTPEPSPAPVERPAPPPEVQAPVEPAVEALSATEPETQNEPSDGRTDPSAGESEVNAWPAVVSAPTEPVPLEPDKILLSVLSDARPHDGPMVKKTPSIVAKPTAENAQTFLQEFKSFWTEDSTASSFDLSEVKLSKDFWDGLDRMSSDLDESLEEEERKVALTTEAAAGVGISMTAGFVSWALRAGSMAASFLTAMPTWRHFDPMPILGADEKKRQGAVEGDNQHLGENEQTDEEQRLDDVFGRD